ncbi:MAG: translation initiation factor IF-3 [Sedimentisphaerales bacterium]|nr:translation initiation factor IF-3 [Sedimentisphaerales bacterium]
MLIKVKGLRVNGGIRADKVRLIDESNNQVGIVDREFALQKARDTALDLVEVAPTSQPPVCRIMDYGKWLYEQKRKIRESHKKSHHVGTLKEIRLRPETDHHDVEIKVNHAREFLRKGHKVLFTLIFRGRQMIHQDKGYELLNKIAGMLADVSQVEQKSSIIGKRMTMVLMFKAESTGRKSAKTEVKTENQDKTKS